MIRTINLYVSIFPIRNEIRDKEIRDCLAINLSLTTIHSIHILNEGAIYKEFTNEKCKLFSTKNRPKFSDFFPLLCEDSINIIANNDIYFDYTLKKLEHLNIKRGDFLALTRKEVDGKLFRSDIGDSQDVWIFYGKPDILKSCDFFMGVPGCDNLIAYKFHEAGFRILNPSKCINCRHLHSSQERSYDEINRVIGNYLFIKPSGIFKSKIIRLKQFFVLKLYNSTFKIFKSVNINES